MEASRLAQIREAEVTYQLRLERLMKAKGTRVMVESLARELRERPRPYVKAWYANYLLYGVEFGLKDLADPARGFVLAQESCEEGSSFGRELVGRAWGDGRGLPARDPAKAVHYLEEAAQADRGTAMSELSKYYFFGYGVPPDRNRAEQWARAAACRGSAAGMQWLAKWREDPAYGVPDHARALALLYEVGQLGSGPARAEVRRRVQSGDRMAQEFVHLDCIVGAVEGSDPLPTQLREAVQWLEAHAAPENPRIQVALAEVMIERNWVVYDVDAATAKLARAVAAGSDDARAVQAMMWWRGIGRRADEAAAVAQWRELAERGNARALNQIGWLHWWGNGVKYGIAKDAGKAFAFCHRAADLGYWAGQLNVADCYVHAIGTGKNAYLAAKYYGILEDRRFKRGREMKERILALVKD